MMEGQTSRVCARFSEQQPLWVLAGSEGTLLCARHALTGLVLLSWTTREELEVGVETLFGQAPHLFVTHVPEQRPFLSLLETAARLKMRLRIDDYVVEDLDRC
jgi:hypothetical protein